MGLVTELENIAGGNLGEGIGDVVKSVGDAVNEKAVLATDLTKTEIQAEAQEVQSNTENNISARTMQSSALGQDDLFSKRFIYYFSIFWSLAGAAYIAFITFTVIPPENVRFADTILGFMLGTAISCMFNYFYGSSQGSHKKDDTIQGLARPWVNPDN